MSANSLLARATNRMKLRELLETQDYSIKELVEESYQAYSTVNNFIRRGLASGQVECVSKTVRLHQGGKYCAGGTVAARYIWTQDKHKERAEALIYRLLDRLIDVPLDAGGLMLVKEAQQFIGWNAL